MSFAAPPAGGVGSSDTGWRFRWLIAPHADARRGLDRPVALPVRLPTSDVVVHDVLADVAVGRAGGRSGEET
jgi:hypothetical protein